jgi:hypothetical protein
LARVPASCARASGLMADAAAAAAAQNKKSRRFMPEKPH